MPPDAAIPLPSPHQVRTELEDLVLKDLLGPAGGPEEEVDEPRANDRYLVGMLAPQRQRIAAEEQDDLAIADDDEEDAGPGERSGPALPAMLPSSVGLSFLVSAEAAAIRVSAKWGHYERLPSEALTTDKGDPKRVWKRRPIAATNDFPLTEGALGPWAPSPDQPEVTVRGKVRRTAGGFVVSLFLVNGQEEPDRLRDEKWLFQVELSIEAPDGRPVFERWPVAHASRSLEDEVMDLRYRDRVEFAAGHGVATHATVAPDNPQRAIKIETQVVPRFEVAQQQPPTQTEIPALASACFDMKELAGLESAEFASRLRPLASAYAAWIVEQRARGTALREHKAAVGEALGACERAQRRIEQGIDLLASDDVAAEAFRFANRAMWLQRTHSLWSEARRRGDDRGWEAFDVEANRRWHPFQLAFLLINLPGLTQLDHPDRAEGDAAIADLLWFPTGGGKTEAYLGLTAFVLALRRLQGIVESHSGENGVAVLMRYTLRLLTLQQFQRATALVCACEHLRREALAGGDKRWGMEPFRIGLWVGQKTTPNTTEQSAESLKRERGHFRVGGHALGTPDQLTHCPWCGHEIDAGKHLQVEPFARGKGRTLVFCGDPLGTCPFSQRQSPGEGVPVLTVDEEIYRLLPSLLIATVDKFAQMPWKGATQMLFGRVSGRCSRHGFRSPDLEDTDSHTKTKELAAARTTPHAPLRPPDLIIQDELHLINGPLGTLVGLYETAVDALCTWEVNGKKVRPKVIASSATVRRAAEQVHALFERRVEVFPPPGLDAADNFFSRERPPSEETPGRLYLGICARGRRVKAALIRVYLAHLAATQLLFLKYGERADPWMTLVGYFNSMRELGGMRRLLEDDIKSRLIRAEDRGLSKRYLNVIEELTSRKNATDIPAILDHLEATFRPEQPQEGKRSKRPIDVLLATNMISVGVDVRRLGLMVVAGQPKATSEYIQATGRVGRHAPGLVCVVYNWARPRDLSHYESFEHYHATFHQHVEPLSVTPFAPRAVDRGLTALLVSLVRLAADDLNANDAVGKLRADHPLALTAIAAIVRRATAVEGDETAKRIEQEALQRLAALVARVSRPVTGTLLGYKGKKDGKTLGLLEEAGRTAWSNFTCPTSLRDVEPTTALILDDRGLDAPPSGGNAS